MKRPLLLAHRGFSGNYPENSPLAFRMAVEKTAADGFESDVHITKDGKLVIFHDASVERTSNGTGFIKNMTYDELLSLDIGAWKSPEFAGHPVIKDEDVLNMPIPILGDDIKQDVVAKVNESASLRRQSKQLLEYAKQAVEMAIEQGEDIALAWLKSKVEQ